jgi:hypothetical protein
MTTDPAPSFTTTYKRADGEMVNDEYGWVTDTDFFDDIEEPLELIREEWTRTAVERQWVLPALYACTAGLDCDEDAVTWEQRGDAWVAACLAHASGVSERDRPTVEEVVARLDGTPSAGQLRYIEALLRDGTVLGGRVFGRTVIQRAVAEAWLARKIPTETGGN